MTVHKKLMQARVKLQGIELKKSGHNKFAGYHYFELGDFLPQIQTIFNEVGLCGVVSYDTDYAVLAITDVEDGTMIVIRSPMAEAALKGTHPIQNLGAVETYQRRYLWMTAMEIVEHDILDATTGNEAPAKPVAKPIPKDQQRTAAPAKAASAEPPPKKMEGKPGPWQISVTTEPDGEFADWAKVVIEATQIALGTESSEADVNSIFRTNKVIYDRLKAEPGSSAYEALLEDFKEAKARLAAEEPAE